MTRLAILGGGAWGTALAQVAARANHEVLLWARDDRLVEQINARRENPRYLPGVALDPAVRATGDLAAAAACEVLLLVVPAQHLRALAARLAALSAQRPLVICSKGIERGSGAVMSEVLAEVLPGRPLAVLSGPTFAGEVARGLPCAVTLACAELSVGRPLLNALGSRRFRPYLSDDVIGVEIGGAVKNVIAIACGIVIGRGLGENARAALITRGFAEVVRLTRAKGGRPETAMGLSGLGDLTLTCCGAQSRNYSLGVALGEGRALGDVLAERHTVAEGVFTAEAVAALARGLGVETPICDAVHAVLNRGADLGETIAGLLARPFRSERA
ncbi:MAG: NAD(P)H-dependent glycerol-3-phosphate dehydrogenase [Kiloniellales bacterium]|nr:NAD(P)H-dependent glycerol-3-phosphate dehydrogenase [Kiloniellales bacterium]